MSENMISVTQFSNYVKSIFANEELLQNISIYGEVSDFKIAKGTAYFNLKDSESLLPCVRFSVDELNYIPNEGDMVIAVGSPNYYTKGGRFSFLVKDIKAYGLGVLYQQFLEMKQKLEKEGLFDASHKKAIPKIIQKIGVVTSETGAVIQDIIDVSHRRNPTLNILLYPAKVQGIGAEQTICAGITALDQTDVDVIIIARGGGSLEDLSPFNTEVVARAIYKANKPIVSAVGHETDFTIADFAADLRAPTPSAAAEIVSVDFDAVIQRFLEVTESIGVAFEDFIEDQKDDIVSVFDQMSLVMEKFIDKKEKPLQKVLVGLKHSIDSCVLKKVQSLDLLTNKIEMNNPLSIIKRGYASVECGEKRITKLSDAKIGDDIKLNVVDGRFIAKVTGKEKI